VFEHTKPAWLAPLLEQGTLSQARIQAIEKPPSAVLNTITDSPVNAYNLWSPLSRRSTSAFTPLTKEENTMHFKSQAELTAYLANHPDLQTLTISVGMTSLPPLPDTLVRLRIDKSPLLTSINALPQSLAELEIVSCPNLVLVSALPPSLQFFRATYVGMVNLPAIPNSLNRFEIYGLAQLQELPTLGDNLTSVQIGDCKKLQNLPQLPDSIERLKLERLPKLSKVSTLPTSLTELTVYRCHRLSELPQLPLALIALTVENCNAMSILSLPQNLSALRVKHCPALISLVSLATAENMPAALTSLWLTDCPSLTSMPTIASALQSLQISSCPGIDSRRFTFHPSTSLHPLESS